MHRPRSRSRSALRAFRCAAVGSAALFVCASTLAQTPPPADTVSIYGLLDLSAGRFQDAGSVRSSEVVSGGMSNSFIGFKGKEDLGGGLKAVFGLESFIRADTGGAGRVASDPFWARAAYVGLQGAFGTSVLGRSTNLFYVSALNFNPFGESLGFAPTMRQIFAPNAGMLPFYGGITWGNAITYASPDNSGWTYNFQANLANGSPDAMGKNIGVNVTYRAGPLGATAAYQRVRNNSGAPFEAALPAGFFKQQSVQLGVSYDLSVVKLYGQVARIDTDAGIDTNTVVYGIGAAVPLGRGALLAQYGHASADFGAFDRTNKTLTIGYDHLLSKNTDVYALYMSDRLTGASNGSTVAAGMRLRF